MPLGDLLERWQAAGIVTADQAMLMSGAACGRTVRLDEVGRPTRPGPSLVVEAVAYLGGVVVVVGAVLLAELSWRELSSISRLLVVGAAAVGLAVAGEVVPGRAGDVFARLRSTLWLGSTVAAAGCLAVLLFDWRDVSSQHALVATGAGTAVVAAGFWRRNRSLVQQVATAGALMFTGGAAVADLVGSEAWPGFGVWLVAASWLLLGWGELVRPRRPVLVLAAAALVLGAVLTLPTAAGFVLAIGTVLAVVALAVVLADSLLLLVGAVGTLQVLPAMVVEWLPRTAAVPFALLVVGMCMVAAVIWVARRRPRDGRGTGRLGPPRPTISRRAALLAAGAVDAVGIGVLVLAGWH